MAALVVPWRPRVLKSLARNKSLAYSRYVQLATVKADGSPACRTVVFRGFLGETSDLTFITNIHSGKVSELAARPDVEVCWYLPTSREQYRLSGSIRVVQHDAAEEELLKARSDVWSALSDAARAQFAWPPPGEPRVADSQAWDPPLPAKDAPLPSFCLLLMSVVQVDLVELFTNKRTLFKLEPNQETGELQWTESDLNP